jgi:SAM-dependent methyltransferase
MVKKIDHEKWGYDMELVENGLKIGDWIRYWEQAEINRLKAILRPGYWRRYWKGRTLAWRQTYMDTEHPHRQVIIDKLKTFGVFRSILEVGCAVGGNLFKIKQVFPGADIGGIDWSPEAIEEARKWLPKASVLQVGEATDIYISAKGSDILLSDMCYIYLDKKNFRRAIQEAKRVARIGVIFCEFHSTSWFKRLGVNMLTGYHAHDYRRELTKAGFYDIEIRSLTLEEWPGAEREKGLRCIITART